MDSVCKRFTAAECISLAIGTIYNTIMSSYLCGQTTLTATLKWNYVNVTFVNMLVLLSFHFIYWQHFVCTTLVVVMLGVTTGVITVLICFHFPAERLKKN